jgi:hypothetical protein
LGWSNALINSSLQNSVVSSSLFLPPPNNGVAVTSTVSVPAVAGTGNQSLLLTGLEQGTSASFSVSECDPITCTPFSSPPLTIATTGPSLVSLALDTTTNVSKTVSPDPSGSISTSVVVPTSAGAHTVMAVVAGSEVAHVTIVVAGSGAPPFIQVVSSGQEIASSNSTVPGLVLEGLPLTVNGFSYPTGAVAAITVNGSGPALGSGTVQPNGSFSISFSLSAPLGIQKLVAATPSPSAQASAPISVETIQ